MFDGLPFIVQAEDGKIYQMNYIDKGGRFRRFKEITVTKHRGNTYYRFNEGRYSEYRLKTIEKKCYKRIDLGRKVKHK